MLKDYKALEEKKLTYEIGMLYNYLNDIENEIQGAISGSALIKYYNLKSNGGYDNRSSCPLHGGTNKTSLEFKDAKRNCICHSTCGTITYVQFISKMENMNLNEAKIFAATKFGNISLGFNSIEDYKDMVRKEIKKRYEETESLDLKDYFDLTILPNGLNKSSTGTHYYKKPLISNELLFNKINNTSPLVQGKFFLKELDINTVVKEKDVNCLIEKGYIDYNQAIITAYKSKLIKDFDNSTNLLNSKEKLYEFIKMKYNISPDIVDKYNLIFFEKTNQPLLYYKDFTQVSDRVLFPVNDHETGLIVGYQGRNANLNLTERCKYINISDYKDDLDIDDKGKEYRKMISLSIGSFLFNLHELKDENLSSIWITEGIADAIKLSSLGYSTISPGQSNLTEHQIQLLDRYWSKDLEINLFFDTDGHKIGQTNSIRIAYKLWQFGFKNINIIRTYAELGKDITDCSVKLKDETLLIKFLELWYKDAFKFKPASNEDLGSLIETNVYNEDAALKVDPRDIKKEVEFAIKYDDIKDFIGAMDRNISKNPITKLKNGDITFIHELVLKTKANFDNTVSNNTLKSETNNVSLDTGISEIGTVTTTENSAYISFRKLSPNQVFCLKKKFDAHTVNLIDEYLTDKQISTIISQVKSNNDLDILKYLMSSKYKETLIPIKDNTKDTTPNLNHSYKDLTPIYPSFPDDDAPF